MSASPGFQGYQFWVWESELMSLGNFSTEYYAVCVAQNRDTVPVLMKPDMSRLPGLFMVRTAGISGWAVDRGTWNSPHHLFHHCSFISEERPGSFLRILIPVEKKQVNISEGFGFVFLFWFVSLSKFFFQE